MGVMIDHSCRFSTGSQLMDRDNGQRPLQGAKQALSSGEIQTRITNSNERVIAGKILC